MNPVGRSPKRSLEAIVNEAERIRSISHNVSAEMKYELQGLKSECVAKAKDLVAVNWILEEQKRQLIEWGALVKGISQA